MTEKKLIDWDSIGEDAKKLFAPPELSDEEIKRIAIDYCGDNALHYWVIEGMKLYREQLKQRQ